MNANRQLLPPLAGEIQTKVGPVRFQFVATRGAPAVLLTNHGSAPTFNYGGYQVRIKFLLMPQQVPGRWVRGDAAEPVVDFVETTDPVPENIRQEAHDALLDAWEQYMTQRPDLPVYARYVNVNNDIVQESETVQRLEQQLRLAKGRRENLEKLERGILAQMPRVAPQPTGAALQLLQDMNANSWLSVHQGVAELHPFNSPTVLRQVDYQVAQQVIMEGYLQLHRNLQDGRTVFKLAKKAHVALEGKQ